MLSTVGEKLGLAPKPDPAPGTKKNAPRGLVLGELLVAFLLLAVAISSLTALMYSVTRNPRVSTQAESVCTGAAAKSGKCVPEKSKAQSASARLLTSGCAARRGSDVRACADSVLSAQSADGTIIRSRTDSAALAMLPKKEKRPKRPDLGFIR